MGQVIVFENDAGGVAVVYPVDARLSIEEVAAKSVPANTPYRIMDSSEIPTDRTNRDAWRLGVSGIEV